MEEDRHIHFPWITIGWATKEEALAALALTPEPQDKEDYHKVVFEVSNAAAYKFCEVRLVCHRLNGQINKAGEVKEEITYY